MWLNLKWILCLMLFATFMLAECLVAGTLPSEHDAASRQPGGEHPSDADAMERFKDDGSQTYLFYGIPQDAEKKGPYPQRSYRWPYVTAYIQPETKKIVAKDFLNKKKIRIKQELYLDGDKHGIQREWYENGRLASEHPYKNGVMHGTFREWDEAGRLICQSTIQAGTGILLCYYANGRLHEQVSYSRNERHGVSVKLYSNGQLLQRVSYAKGFEYGESVVFHKNGKLRGVAFSDNHGRPHGQIVEYDESGNLEQIKFYVHGNKVDQAQYAKAVTSDASLPPLAPDPLLYKDRVMTANLKQMIEELRNQQPVRIPLEVDARTSSDSP